MSVISNVFWKETKQRWRERVGEWRDKKHSICKFCSLWWCWKGNVLDRQSVPLVKFFHCVSFLNQTLFQSSSTHSLFPSHCLIHILLFILCYFSVYFLLSGPPPHLCLFPFFSFILNHAISFLFLCAKSSFFFACSLTAPPPFFYIPAKVIYWVDELLFSRMQITLKSVPISDQTPGSKLQHPMHYLKWPLGSLPIQRLTLATAPSNPIDCQISKGV